MNLLDMLSNPMLSAQTRPFGLPTPGWMPQQQAQVGQMPDFGRMANAFGASEIGAGITPWQLQSQWSRFPDMRQLYSMFYRGMF